MYVIGMCSLFPYDAVCPCNVVYVWVCLDISPPSSPSLSVWEVLPILILIIIHQHPHPQPQRASRRAADSPPSLLGEGLRSTPRPTLLKFMRASPPNYPSNLEYQNTETFETNPMTPPGTAWAQTVQYTTSGCSWIIVLFFIWKTEV